MDDRGVVVARETTTTPASERSRGIHERDLEQYWLDVAALIRKLVLGSGVTESVIQGVGIAAQGDGLCLLDAEGRPVAPAILSTDTRAADVVRQWHRDGSARRAQAKSGVSPFAGSPAALLRWYSDNNADVLARARWVVSTKDWLRFKLTGVIGTDRTDGSASFASPSAQAYCPGILAIYGLARVSDLLPPLHASTALAGEVTDEAATSTGLTVGTPVAVGMQDAVATMVGSIALREGALALTAGTFGVNSAFVQAPKVVPQLSTRLGPVANWWTLRRTSSSSASSLDWFAQVLGIRRAELGNAISRALAQPPEPDLHFLPYLVGGRSDRPSSASFVGLNSGHTSVDLVRAVLEGIAFSHRLDLDIIRSEVDINALHLLGGAAQSPQWTQLFANVVDHPLYAVTDVSAGIRGAAISSLAAVSRTKDLRDACEQLSFAGNLVQPERAASHSLERRFHVFEQLVAEATG